MTVWVFMMKWLEIKAFFGVISCSFPVAEAAVLFCVYACSSFGKSGNAPNLGKFSFFHLMKLVTAKRCKNSNPWFHHISAGLLELFILELASHPSHASNWSRTLLLEFWSEPETGTTFSQSWLPFTSYLCILGFILLAFQSTKDLVSCFPLWVLQVYWSVPPRGTAVQEEASCIIIQLLYIF